MTEEIMQVLSISTYDYLRNTCLHYIYELELVPYRCRCNCHMMNIIQQIADPMPTIFLHIDLAKLLLLLLLLSLLQNYYYHCYRYCCCYHYYQSYHITVLLITLLQIINLQVWLNWQLSCYYLQIFFGPPCVESINLGWILYLENCCDPLYLWVIEGVLD